MITHLTQLQQHIPLIVTWLRYRVYLRYAQAALGVLWHVLVPLLSVGVYAFALGEILGAKTLVDVPFVPFLLIGQLQFSLFSAILLNTRGALLGAAPIVRQVRFPLEVVLLMVVGETLVDFTFGFAVMVIVNTLYGLQPSAALLWVVVPVTLTLCFSLGLSLLLSLPSVALSDLQPLLTVLVQLLFFITPIFYSPDIVPDRYRLFISMNPLTPLIELGRQIVLYGQQPSIVQLFQSAALSLGTLSVGYWAFKRSEPQIIDML